MEGIKPPKLLRELSSHLSSTQANNIAVHKVYQKRLLNK